MIAKKAKITLTDEWETAAIHLVGNTTISATDSDLKKWDEIISFSLVEWGRDPSRFGDEIIAPTPIALSLSCQMAIKWRDAKIPPPVGVVPSGDGGIYFRWGTVGQLLFTAEFTAEGKANAVTTQNCDVISREEVI